MRLVATALWVLLSAASVALAFALILFPLAVFPLLLAIVASVRVFKHFKGEPWVPPHY